MATRQARPVEDIPAGVTVLDGEGIELDGVGYAGVMGATGGFVYGGAAEADALHEAHWVGGQLALGGGVSATGLISLKDEVLDRLTTVRHRIWFTGCADGELGPSHRGNHRCDTWAEVENLIAATLTPPGRRR